MKVIVFYFLCMITTLAIVQGKTLRPEISGTNNNILSNKNEECKDIDTAKACKKIKKKKKCDVQKFYEKCLKTCDKCEPPTTTTTQYGCDVKKESRVICKLTEGNKCPDYCCDVENQCYERKGFGTLIKLINTLQSENSALKTEITKNEENIETNNDDIKANAASIAQLEEEIEKINPDDLFPKTTANPNPACGLPNYADDMFCDDVNNNEECNWDGGACCQESFFNINWDQYCTACECLDPNVTVCAGNDASIGNGFCDDINNNKECNYDGGDCCGSCKVTDYCTNCTCLQDPGTYDIFGPQLVQGWRGNKYCDDFLNKVECNFDDGDCCGSDVNTDFCQNCECHLASCPQAGSVGDGKCNKKANNAECNFDGGDCCSQCKEITVSFNFEGPLGSLIGTYNLDQSMINGKPSWTSISNSLWYSQGTWLMGPSEHKGTNAAFIFSALGNQCPFTLQSVFWNFNNGGLGWQAIPGNVLNIDCSKK